MTEKDAEELIARLCDADGALPEAEGRALVERLRASPDARRAVAAHLLVARNLPQLARAPYDPAPVMAALPAPQRRTEDEVMRLLPARRARPPRARPVWRWAIAGGGLFAAAAAIIVALKPAPSPVSQPAAPAATAERATAAVERTAPAVVAAASGLPVAVAAWGPGVELGEPGAARPAAPGDRLEPGATLWSAPSAPGATLELAADARLLAGAATTVTRARLPGPAVSARAPERSLAVELAAGVLIADLGAASPSVSVAVAGASVRAERARFEIRAAGGGARVTVARGAVTIERPGSRGVSIRSGEEARVSAAAVQRTPAERRALLVVGQGPLRPDDERLQDRLSRLGFTVAVATDSEATRMQAEAATLVLVSSTVESEVLDGRFRDVGVPVIVCEPWILFDMGMTGPKVFRSGLSGNRVEGRDRLELERVDHPLAAGLSGSVQVAARPVSFSAGRPNAVAITIATVGGELDRAAIFAYERGAAMPGLPAPERRLAFFLHDGAALALTPAGWSLFDAAVRWSVGSAGSLGSGGASP